MSRHRSLTELNELAVATFLHMTVPDADARRAAEILTLSDSRGIDSHGVARLTAYYGMWKKGRLNPHPEVKVVRETGGTALLDGDNGLGLVVGPQANDLAIEKASKNGVAWVGVRNSSHFGIAGYYALEARKRDTLGIVLTNTGKVVAPLWGAEAMLGTNPIAIAFPGEKTSGVVIDMATSAVPYGAIQLAKARHEPIPEGWGLDESGHGTTDPAAVLEGGTLLPLGLDRLHGGHKGYCLAALVDLLCGPLVGASWGKYVAGPFTALAERKVGLGVGHTFVAIKIDAFCDPLEFRERIDDWVDTMRACRPQPGTSGPIIPGDPEEEQERIRRTQGVVILPDIEAGLIGLAKEIRHDFK